MVEKEENFFISRHVAVNLKQEKSIEFFGDVFCLLHRVHHINSSPSKGLLFLQWASSLLVQNIERICKDFVRISEKKFVSTGQFLHHCCISTYISEEERIMACILFSPNLAKLVSKYETSRICAIWKIGDS